MSNSVSTLSLIIVFFPLIAAVWIFVNMYYWSDTKVQYVALSAIGSSLVLSSYLLCLLYVSGVSSFTCTYGLWFFLSVPVKWGFLIDELTVCMFFIVSLISFIVYFFSIDYMKSDPNLNVFLYTCYYLVFLC